MEERTSGSNIPATDSEAEGEDRISSLPDEIIHDILDRLRSPKRIAKLSFLSKRWNHLWLSYPILKLNSCEFRWPMQSGDLFYDRAPIEPLKAFAATLLRKLSHNRAASITTVRISAASYRWGPKFCSGFLDDVLDLLASSSTHEIDFRFGHDCNLDELDPPDYTAYNVPQRLLQFQNLKVLKLAFCDFRLYGDEVTSDTNDNNPFAGLASCLELLELDHVSFPNDGILNSIISGASRLKTLILYSVFGIGRFQVRNHPNLRVLKARRMVGDIVEITGCRSLRTLKLFYWEKGELQVSSTPNLKVLYIENTDCGPPVITDKEFGKLIREFPSLKSVTLENSV
ncbi:hypothetical protein LINGRAHAP2_LOCUS21480 [Linum grandiflorum]